MAIPKFLEDLLIISKLGDNPGTDNGLSSSGLRAKFDEAGVKIQQYINNTLIPALSELADPTAGLNMKGNISMGGHRVTELGDPVEDGDAVPLGYAGQHFAPAGYGLGTEGGQLVDVTDFSQLDALNRNGHYFVRFHEPFYIDGQFAQYLTVDVSGETGQHIHQTIHIIGTNYIIRRNSDNGVWGNIEWDNPPMMPNEEYRTTKRHNGKAVYTKLITYSPSNFTAQIIGLPHGIANFDCGLSINVSWLMNGNNWRHLPAVCFSDTAWNGQTYWNSIDGIAFELGESLRERMAASSRDILVTVEYTKTT